MSFPENLTVFVKELLDQKKYSVTLANYRIFDGNHKLEPIAFHPVRNGEKLKRKARDAVSAEWRETEWFQIDPEAANLRVVADFNCGEIDRKKGCEAAIIKAIEEQLFNGVTFHLQMIEGTGIVEGVAHVEIVPDKEVNGLVSNGVLNIPVDQLFPSHTVEHEKVVAANEYFEAKRRHEEKIPTTAIDVESHRDRLASALAIPESA